MLGENVENRIGKYVRARECVRDWGATEKKEVDVRTHCRARNSCVSKRLRQGRKECSGFTPVLIKSSPHRLTNQKPEGKRTQP